MMMMVVLLNDLLLEFGEFCGRRVFFESSGKDGLVALGALVVRHGHRSTIIIMLL